MEDVTEVGLFRTNRLRSVSEDELVVHDLCDLQLIILASGSILSIIDASSPLDDSERLRKLLHFSSQALMLTHVQIDALLPCRVICGLRGIVLREYELANPNRVVW